MDVSSWYSCLSVRFCFCGDHKSISMASSAFLGDSLMCLFEFRVIVELAISALRVKGYLSHSSEIEYRE